jgi:hypothetical protein
MGRFSRVRKPPLERPLFCAKPTSATTRYLSAWGLVELSGPKPLHAKYSYFQNTATITLFQRGGHSMEQTPTPGRRLNVLGKAARRKRIFARLREGWAYDEIAGEERVSAERVRQIVAEVLGKRVIDRGVDHAHCSSNA